MKAYTSKQIQKELAMLSHKQLLDLLLRLIRFKKENKELLSYLLFESENEDAFIESVKAQLDVLFDAMNTNSYFYMKKTARKILNQIKKYVRYSKKKETEIELLLYFCQRMASLSPSIKNAKALYNIYQRQILAIEKNIPSVHEDLQYDYQNELSEIKQIA